MGALLFSMFTKVIWKNGGYLFTIVPSSSDIDAMLLFEIYTSFRTPGAPLEVY